MQKFTNELLISNPNQHFNTRIFRIKNAYQYLYITPFISVSQSKSAYYTILFNQMPHV